MLKSLQTAGPLTKVVDYQGTEENPVVLHENRFFKMLHNGRFHYVEGLRYQKGVVMIPVLPNGDLVMVNVHRLPAIGLSLEFPRGGVEAGEVLCQAAERELQEETSYLARTVRQIGRVAPETATVNGVEDVFRIDVHEIPQQTGFDKDEIDSVRIVSRSDFHSLVSSGQVVCGHTLAAYAQLLIDEMRSVEAS